MKLFPMFPALKISLFFLYIIGNSTFSRYISSLLEWITRCYLFLFFSLLLQKRYICICFYFYMRVCIYKVHAFKVSLANFGCFFVLFFVLFLFCFFKLFLTLRWAGFFSVRNLPTVPRNAMLNAISKTSEVTSHYQS